MIKKIILALVILIRPVCSMAQDADDAHAQFKCLPVYQVEARILGRSYPADCPVKLDELRYLQVLHYGYDGEIHLGEMVCNAAVADDLLEVFMALFDAGYQICSVRLIDDFGAEDLKSMEADNSSCFNFRAKTGQSALSAHALGLAVDINPVENPYVHGSRILPESGTEFADRERSFEHRIDKNDLCYKLFKEKGFQWGGEWRNSKDYQHFEKMLP